MRVLRSYPDTKPSESANEFNAIFGKATDTDTQHPFGKQLSVIGFPDGGAVAIPLTISAGQTPLDLRIDSGEGMVKGGNARVKLNVSRTAGDYGNATFKPPGGAVSGLRVGNGANQAHAYPEAHPGETWYVNAVAEDGGPFWLGSHPTAR